MPEIGDQRGRISVVKVKEIFVECPRCYTQRWITLHTFKRCGETGICFRCGGKGNENPRLRPRVASKDKDNKTFWDNGHTIENRYLLVRLHPDDFYYSMARSSGYVFEHRLVMAKHLGRPLHAWEFVHHKNDIKTDNRIENLTLASADGHAASTVLQEKVKRLEAQLASK